MSGLVITDPVGLRDALRSQNINAGDTLLLRGGVYSGNFNCALWGTIGNPITIKPYANETVIIDGSFTVNPEDSNGKWGDGSQYITIENIEFRNTKWVDRSSAVQEQPMNVYSTSKGIQLINCIIHDGAECMEFFGGGIDLLYGCLLYNGGFHGDTGHTIYTHNNDVTRNPVIDSCIILGSMNYGFHAHSSGANHIYNYLVQNCIFGKCNGKNTFGNDSGLDYAVDNCTFTDNENMGTWWWMNRWSNLGKSMVITDNWFDGSNIFEAGCMKTKEFETLTVTGNTFVHEDNGLVYCKFPTTIPFFYTWDNNQYYAPAGNNFQYYSLAEPMTDFAGWQLASGFDGASAFTAGVPANRIRVIANTYDANRCNIAIYNYMLSDSITVDVSSVYSNGDIVRVHHSQDYFGDYQDLTVAGGNITIDMRAISHTAAKPYGWPTNIDPLMPPKYGAFIAQKL